LVYKKKSLGQHFLKNKATAEKLVNSLVLPDKAAKVIEIGPGQGALTQHLINRNLTNLYLVEKDDRFKDILKLNWAETFGNSYHIVGNFPYNISTMLLFSMFDNRNDMQQMVGLFQREVGQRACSPKGNKTYGILSVLLQAFYQAEYLLELGPEEFDPPPKVHSGLIRLTKKAVVPDIKNVKRFKAVVKAAFNLRRKKLSNSLKQFDFTNNELVTPLLTKRPEHLDYNDFIFLANNTTG